MIKRFKMKSFSLFMIMFFLLFAVLWSVTLRTHASVDGGEFASIGAETQRDINEVGIAGQNDERALLELESLGAGSKLSAQASAVGTPQTNMDNALSINVDDLGEPLKSYLLELAGTETLTANSFSAFSELVFDGQESLQCAEIVQVAGLSQFSFANLRKLTFKNMSNIEYIDIANIVNDNSDNKVELIIENCPNLTALDYSTNARLEIMRIIDCEKLNFTLLNSVAQSLRELELVGVGGEKFDIISSMPYLKAVTLKNNTALKKIDLQASSNLKLCDIENNANLTSFVIRAGGLNELTFKGNENLQVLDLTHAQNLKVIYFDEMTFDEEGYVVERNLLYAPNLKKVFVRGNDWLEEFDISYSPRVETLVFYNCNSLNSLHLSETLNYLQTLDLTKCYNLANVDFASAVNLQSLSLAECDLIIADTFRGIANMFNLQYLNLSSTNIRDLTLENFADLQIILLGSNYLSSITLTNLPKLYKLDMSTSRNLKNVTVSNVENLKTISFSGCENVENLELSGVGFEKFDIAGMARLQTLKLTSESLGSLKVYDCENLMTLDFAECANLLELEVCGCNALNSDVVENLDELMRLESIVFSECNGIYNFNLANLPNIIKLDLSGLYNISILGLKNLGTYASIALPYNSRFIRSLSLINLLSADFGGDSLNFAGGVISSVTLDGVPFRNINLMNNAISSFSIDNCPYLGTINLANNRITNAETVLKMLDLSVVIQQININNNRIDFSKGSYINDIQSNERAYSMVIGIQNIIIENEYTYEPNIYFGGFGNFYPSVEVVVYHSNKKYSKANLTASVLRTFDRDTFSRDKFKKFENGTYYITYQKVDAKGHVVDMTEEELAMFVPIYFSVSKEVDIVQFIWIIFVVVAGLIFIYVGVSYIFDRRRKARVFDEDGLDSEPNGMGAVIGNSKADRVYKKVERQRRRAQKDAEKQSKKEAKALAVAGVKNGELTKEEAKALKEENLQNIKLARIAEKERLKEEKEQAKLDREREKLKAEEEKKQAKANSALEKQRKQQEKEQAKLDREREKLLKERAENDKKISTKEKKPKSKCERVAKTTIVSAMAVAGAKDDNKKQEREQTALERENQKLIIEQEKEVARLAKDHAKLEKEREKSRLKEEKQQKAQEKIVAKEQAKLARISAKEHKKAEKEAKLRDREQAKLRDEEMKAQAELDREREKLLRDRERAKKNEQIIKPEKDEGKTMRKEERERAKELKRERKELARLEKENLREEKIREKTEDGGRVFNFGFKRKSKSDVDEPLAVVRGHEDVDDEGAISDSDIADILSGAGRESSDSNKATAPKMPSTAPKSMPKLPKFNKK